jgi:16S rRNA (cytidine1402-2'-O)-methyltransferase
MSALILVATPIGNLGDISSRALESLRNADVIACEDTRYTLKLLSHFGIQKPLISYHEFNEQEKSHEIVGMIEAGKNVALVSDAGTPAISDPGYRVVRLCRERGLDVISIPGPNAAIAALSASGLPSDQFMFVGFLPPRQSARKEYLATLKSFTGTLIFYEAPHRILATIDDIREVLGDREACICRELTKIHEEYQYGKLSEVKERIREIGEFVVVVGGSRDEENPVQEEWTRERVLKTLGISRNQLYELFFKK